MNNTINNFETNKYVHLPQFLDEANCAQFVGELKKLVKNNQTLQDDQCPSSQAIYGAVAFDSLLDQLRPYFEQACGRKLLPTYSYARMYAPGEELKIHKDRPSCEISATLTLGFEGDVWPIYMGNNEDKSEASEIKMGVGDAVLYQGMDIYHWREKYTEGKWQAQVFLHYVDAEGDHTEWKYDKRKHLNIPPERDSIRFWYYTDILTSAACDSLIRTYTQEGIETKPPYIGGGEGLIDLDTRNVERVMLPTYKDIGGRLAAAGFDANRQAWQFNITHANQAEFLKYNPEGRYVAHMDTFLFPSDSDCRKLTVLAFLNDDFEGGKFFIQDGSQKMYPPQSKGTVLVFPSFLVHGVEDVISGTRYSVVCWLVGPFFK